jgi:hypothetical protein
MSKGVDLIRVKLTQKHIRVGIRGAAHFCPIALAIKDTEPNAEVVVGCAIVLIGETHYDMDDKAVGFVRRFDRGDRLHERGFTFDLRKSFNQAIF